MAKVIDNGVKAFYNTAGDNFSATRKWLWPEMLPYLNTLKDNDTVLDIGCGNGRLLNGITAKVAYTGVDFSTMLIANARKLHPQNTFIEGDILDKTTWDRLPEAEAIFCVAVLHHIPQDKLAQLFGLMAKHLKLGGLLYVSSWNLWQKRYFCQHCTAQSLLSKWKNKSWRSVLVPFQKQQLRYCLAYTQSDLKRATTRTNLQLETAFFSSSSSYWSGKNLVQVYRKV